MTNQLLHVRILSPQQLFLDSDALSVSSENLDGKFDILAQHANFITLIESQPIVVRIPQNKPLVYKFPLAIISAKDNKVDIFTYIQPNLAKK